MSISRRKFTRNALLGGVSFVTTSIFFQKPAESYSLEDFPLTESTSRNVFDNVLRYTDLQLIGESLPRTDPRISSTVQFTENEFVQRQFTQGRTPFANTNLSVSSGVLWGRQKQETLGPNAGFASAQINSDGEPTRVAFSGSTTVGLNGAVQVLADQRLSPSDISKLIIPTRVQFEDWGSWEGEVSQGAVSQNSDVTNYRTRRGEVTRFYRLVEPGRGGFGIIHIVIEGELQPRRDISMKVTFA
jgi:hypothetical protein